MKSRAPASFKAQVNDTEKRLNILFDHLNNEDLLKGDTIMSMVELSQAIQAKDFEQAQAIHVEIMTNKTEECGNWMVRLPFYLSTPETPCKADQDIGWGETFDRNEQGNAVSVNVQVDWYPCMMWELCEKHWANLGSVE